MRSAGIANQLKFKIASRFRTKKKSEHPYRYASKWYHWNTYKDAVVCSYHSLKSYIELFLWGSTKIAYNWWEFKFDNEEV